MLGFYDGAGFVSDSPIIAADNVAFRSHESVGTPVFVHFAAQFPACVCPCQRFIVSLTAENT
jgi:hypothetical protein